MTRTWQRRRASFNHNWLKNQYLPALSKWVNLLDQRLVDSKMESTFVLNVLPQWESRRSESLSIPADFKSQMSPRRLMEEKPLSHYNEETKAWLSGTVHHLWLARYPVQTWIDQALDQAREADRTYLELQEALSECEALRSADALHPFRDDFAAFRTQCQELAMAIEQFPSEIKVV